MVYEKLRVTDNFAIVDKCIKQINSFKKKRLIKCFV